MFASSLAQYPDIQRPAIRIQQGNRYRSEIPRCPGDRSGYQSDVASVLGSSLVISLGTFLTRFRPPHHIHRSPVPSNFQFQLLDILADPLPWGPSSFDVVHFRFLLIHVRSRQILAPCLFENRSEKLITHAAAGPTTRSRAYHPARQARRLAYHRRSDDNRRRQGGCAGCSGGILDVVQVLGIQWPGSADRRETRAVATADRLVQRSQRP